MVFASVPFFCLSASSAGRLLSVPAPLAQRRCWSLACSFMPGEPVYILLMLSSITVSFLAGRRFAAHTPARRRAVLSAWWFIIC